MNNPWIEKLEIQLYKVKIYSGHRPRKVMWEENVLGQTIEGGDILEFGVADGGSIGWFTKNFPDTSIYGFDSFLGLPEDWDLGDRVLRKGTFSTNGIPPKLEKVNYVQGWFEDSFPRWFDKYSNYIKIAHIDSDLYSSAKIVLENIYPFLRAGSFILFDELTHFPDHPQYLHNRQHEYKAFEEFLLKNPTFDYQVIGRTSMCQVAIKVIKL